MLARRRSSQACVRSKSFNSMCVRTQKSPSNALFGVCFAARAATTMTTMRRRFSLCGLLVCLLLAPSSSLMFPVENNLEKEAQKQEKRKNLRAHFLAPHLANTPHPALHLPVQDGVTFTRTIKHLNATFELNLEDGHCATHDKYGDNNCHYDWGEQVLGNYSVQSPHVIEHGDYMTGSFRVRTCCGSSRGDI